MKQSRGTISPATLQQLSPAEELASDGLPIQKQTERAACFGLTPYESKHPYF
jgi:hypothetical protein